MVHQELLHSGIHGDSADGFSMTAAPPSHSSIHNSSSERMTGKPEVMPRASKPAEIDL
jgi:hypothetical protein